METETSLFGNTKNGEPVYSHTLRNRNGMSVSILNYGGIIVSCMVPDANGRLRDVVLGYSDIAPYEENPMHFGALIGRYANRIAKGRLEVNGKIYTLACNDGANHLHGGLKGFEHRLWEASSEVDGLILRYESADGEEHYPGMLRAVVTYRLTDENILQIDYHAESDRDTVCNLTNHSYFNLNGHQSGDILSHTLTLDADYYTPSNDESIPLGNKAPVAGTPMDFHLPQTIGARINDDFVQLRQAGGYDHNYIVREYDGSLRKFASISGEESGISMEMYTTLPGVQFYSGNYIPDGTVGKDGIRYVRRAGFCLESQYFPNLLTLSGYPSPYLKKGNPYRQTTLFRFGIRR